MNYNRRKPVITQPKTTQAFVKKKQQEMAVDLIKSFRWAQDESERLIRKAAREGWTIQQLEDELSKI